MTPVIGLFSAVS